MNTLLAFCTANKMEWIQSRKYVPICSHYYFTAHYVYRCMYTWIMHICVTVCPLLQVLPTSYFSLEVEWQHITWELWHIACCQLSNFYLSFILYNQPGHCKVQGYFENNFWNIGQQYPISLGEKIMVLHNAYNSVLPLKHKENQSILSTCFLCLYMA